MFKNLKISRKMIVAFGVIISLFVASVILSIVEISNVSKTMDTFYESPHQVSVASWTAKRHLVSIQRNMLRALFSLDKTNTEQILNEVSQDVEGMKTATNILNERFLGDKNLVKDFEKMIKEATTYREQIVELAGKNNQDDNERAIEIYEKTYYPQLVEATKKLDAICDDAQNRAVEFNESGKTTKQNSLVLLISLAIVSFIISIFLCIRIIRSIKLPVYELEHAARNMANGNLDIDISYKSNDELGSLAESMKITVSGLHNIVNDIGYILGEMAGGNFEVLTKCEESYVGDFKPILLSIRNIRESLNKTLLQINESSDQVSSGSDQVASGAQALSQGATEQASSVEELAATISEISSQISQNAGNSSQASVKADSVGKEATESNKRMQDMLGAMSDISNKSNEIGKIIKTIEDIAFQTNILALNAAVEAARAGAAGKGFAVVADEVRNLASKSAEASKNTAYMIEGSLKAVENGKKIADETAKSLITVVEGVKEVNDTINKISRASNEQAQSIEQVTQGIDQISSVVQTNSATAEESAAASEELSGQAQMLKDLVSQFKLKKTI